MKPENPLPAFAGRLHGEILRGQNCAYGQAPVLAEGAFNQLALELFHHQFSANASYRRFCELRGVRPGALDDWRKIPAIPTEGFKEYELTCLPAADRTTVFYSSGTTGQQPSRHYHSKISLGLYECSLWSWFARHVIPPAGVQPEWLLALAPRSVDAPNSSLAHMFNCIATSLNMDRAWFACRMATDGGWQIDERTVVPRLREAVASRKPGLVLATAFGLVHLFDALDAGSGRFTLPEGTSVMETGGYKGRSRALPKTELHRDITHWLGVPARQIVTEYGMSELSSQAYDCTAGNSPASGARIFHFPPWARAQVISPETGGEAADGETGLIRVFDLANVFSVLAVQTGDLGVRRGDGFELIGRAENLEPRGCSLLAIA